MSYQPIVEKSNNALIRSALRHLSTNGETYVSNDQSHNSNQPLVEALNCHLQLSNAYHRLPYSNVFPAFFNPGLAVARFFYMLSGSDKMHDIVFYTGGIKPYSDDDISIPGSSYGHRIFYPTIGVDQFENAAELIRHRKNTKRAAIAIYQPQDCGRKTKDLPCCLSMVFSPRNDKLHASVVMRANDAFSLLCYNIFEFSLFFEFFANYTQMKLGNYSHFAISLHVRNKNIQRMQPLANETINSLPMHRMPAVEKTTRKALIDEEFNIKKAIMSQKKLVVRNAANRIIDSYDPYWADLLITLLAQGSYINLPQNSVHSILSRLNLTSRFHLTQHYLKFSHAMSTPKQSQAA
jgi:thymidylate synthase